MNDKHLVLGMCILAGWMGATWLVYFLLPQVEYVFFLRSLYFASIMGATLWMFSLREREIH